jgi:ubiquinol-cytochrome c reductase cytochrome b subunit
LTAIAMVEDRSDKEYRTAVDSAEEDGARAIELAQAPRGIPDIGATSLLRNDPKTQGPILFTRHCASCHAHEAPAGDSSGDRHSISPRDPSAPDLYQFGSREWITGFLDSVQIDQGTRFFGTTAHKDGDMVDFVKDTLTDPDQWTKPQIDAVITALVAEAGIETLDQDNQQLQTQLEQGRELLKDTERCAMCHKFYDENEDAYGPDLTGYRSRQWTIDFIKNPSHERFYGDNNDRMPAYGKHPDNPKNNILTQREIELMVDWLRGDWYERAQENRQ